MKKVLKKKKSETIVQKKPAIVKQKNSAIVKQENPVYFKLRHQEAVNSKKDLLNTEISFLTLLKIIKKYNLWREEELRIKSEIFRKMKEMDSSLQKTKAVFPFLEIPERIRRREIIELKPVKEEEKEKPAEENSDEDLESQLREIQARLGSIGR